MCCINSHDFLHLQIIRKQNRIRLFDLPGQFPALLMVNETWSIFF